MSQVLDPNAVTWRGFTGGMRESRWDDTPRLVFCDHLEETYGFECYFAQLIRTQVEYNRWDSHNELGAAGWDSRFMPPSRGYFLQQECHDHLRRSWLTWPCTRGLEPHVLAQWRWHRGFPSRVVCPFDHWTRHADTLAGIGPLGEVFLCDMPDIGRTTYPTTRKIGFHISDVSILRRAKNAEYLVDVRDRRSWGHEEWFTRRIAEAILREIWREGVEVEGIQIDPGLNALRLPDEPVTLPPDAIQFP